MRNAHNRVLGQNDPIFHEQSPELSPEDLVEEHHGGRVNEVTSAAAGNSANFAGNVRLRLPTEKWAVGNAVHA